MRVDQLKRLDSHQTKVRISTERGNLSIENKKELVRIC
jgi:hypothetical protein